MLNNFSDIKPQWLSVVRRLQSVAKSNGLSIVKINILCDADGVPIAWIEPTQIKIEPKKDVSAFLSLLTKDGNM